METRWLLSATRIVSWNTLNQPNNASEDAAFRTVLQEIGNQTVAGNAARPSILALQETDAFFTTQGQYDGVNSIARIDAILEDLYPGVTYETAVSPYDTGADMTGFVYDTGVVDLVSTSIVDDLPGNTRFAHNILRGQFRPVGSFGNDDFYIYTTHLKAGNDSGDQTRRTGEAAAIRVDIESLGAGVDALVVGDFNIGGSSEGAYQNFTAAGVGQLIDPIGRPGEWKNNPAFSDIHTQNPAVGNNTGGLDDRYDFQIVTETVLSDPAGLQYIEGSYRAFGNDDTHVFNGDILSNNGRPGRIYDNVVRQALADASDHLPVVVDYNLDINPVPGVTVTPSVEPASVSESGGSVQYVIRLDTAPQQNVSVVLSADEQIRIDGGATQTLVFSPSDATIGQTVVITAVDDDAVEGQHTGSFSIDLVTSDPDYTLLNVPDVGLTIFDNDATGSNGQVVISEIMYNPASDESDGFAEWIEVVNVGTDPVDIGGWFLDDEDTSDWAPIPTNTPALPAGGVAVIHNDAIDSEVFRSEWGIGNEALVIGVSWGSLANGPSTTSEIISLYDASGDPVTGQGLIDVVNYDDDGEIWPADNGTSSIYLLDPLADNNVGQNWALSTNDPQSASPTGPVFDPRDEGSPGTVVLPDRTAPSVVDVKIASNGWTEPFLATIDPSAAVGYSIFDASQSINLPWINLNQVIVQFDEPVSVPAATDLVLSGLSAGNAGAAIMQMEYDAATFTATATLDQTLVADRMQLAIGDGIADLSGNTLTPVSFSFDVLPGDVLGTGDVSIFDLFATNRGIFATPGNTRYSTAADVNGDGNITIFDVFDVNRRLFDTLPPLAVASVVSTTDTDRRAPRMRVTFAIPQTSSSREIDEDANRRRRGRRIRGGADGLSAERVDATFIRR